MLTISLEELPGSVFEQSLLGVSDSFDGYWKDHPFIPLQSLGFWDGKSSRGLMVWHLAVFPMDDLNTRLTEASSCCHGFKIVFCDQWLQKGAIFLSRAETIVLIGPTFEELHTITSALSFSQNKSCSDSLLMGQL